MPWFDSHRRLREQLSAYIDGELNTMAIARMHTHLAGCESCRTELDQLRATSAALRDLPEAGVPRSFTLTPQRVAGHRPSPSPSLTPLAIGMRLATAGVAVALAIVVVGDLADLGGRDGVSKERTQTSMDRSEGALRDDDLSYGVPAATPTESSGSDGFNSDGTGGGTEADGGVGTGGGGDGGVGTGGPTGGGTDGGADGGTGDTSGGEVAPEPAPPETEVAEPSPEAGDAVADRDDSEEEPSAGAPAPQGETDQDGTDEKVADVEDGDGGFDALTAAEIGLGVALVAFGVGSLASAYKARRERAG